MDSNKERLRFLITQCLASSTAANEREELLSYFDDAKYHGILEEVLLESFYTNKEQVDISKERQDLILGSIFRTPPPEGVYAGKTVRFKRWLVAASIAAVLLIATFISFYKSNRPAGKSEIAYTLPGSLHREITKKQPVPKGLDEKPASNGAVLTLFDGSEFELGNLKSGEVINKDGVEIRKSEEGSVEFMLPGDELSDSLSDNLLNSIATPRGETYKITLADGTLVKLNSGTRLSFPTRFTGSERRVTLEGEAYFEVSSNPEMQFIVASGKGHKQQEIAVYGTVFNISAYPDDDKFVTTLVEGSVKVKELNGKSEQFLKPLEQATYAETGMSISAADLDLSLAWINQLFYFSNSPVETVMNQISRWYDVDIVYAGQMPTTRIWGQISRNKQLFEVLEILQQTNDLHFKVTGKEVEVSKLRN